MFKAGDKVRCVEGYISGSGYSHLDIGRVYTILNGPNQAGCYELVETPDCWSGTRFEAVNSIPQVDTSSIIQQPIPKRTIKEGKFLFPPVGALTWSPKLSVWPHSAGCILNLKDEVFDAANLRKLAQVANELADVLEE